jgi:DNA-directed RNA polymerase specialized sigma24 family protein
VSSPGSVTHWINRLKEGDRAAAGALWERYFNRLMGLARAKLEGAPRRAADEEDVVLKAFETFFRHAAAGDFPLLRDRKGLWALLSLITARKAYHQRRHEGRRKPPGGAVLDEGAFANLQAGAGADPDIDQLFRDDPTAEEAVLLLDEVQRLLDKLPDDDTRAVTRWTLEGHDTEAIAHRLNCSARTVRRKLVLVRAIWEAEVPP